MSAVQPDQPAEAALVAGDEEAESAETSAGEAEATGDAYRPEFSPELFIGIARPLGTSSEAPLSELVNALDHYGYTVYPVKISKLLEDSLMDETGTPVSAKFDERIETLIAEGNRICAEAQSGAAVADMAVDEIRRQRPEEADTGDSKTAGERGNARSLRRVFLIDSLKRPDEVLALRNLYGDHFILLGLQSAETERIARMRAELATRGTSSGADAKARASEILRMDNQKDLFGQQMTTTLAMSDAFIRVDGDSVARREMRRTVEIMFGDPKAEAPSVEEYGMNLARQTSLRSPELGLRVGAAILSPAGDVLATGYNHHPTASGAPEYDFAAVDLQGLARNTMHLLADAELLSPAAVSGLNSDPDKFIRALLKGPMKESQLRGVTEYQRPVHAEMDALLSALRQGVDVAGATIYVTDFPCHGCARHLIALKLTLVYLVPYTKSKAADMYGDDTDKFMPFNGVTPSRYQQWFGDGMSEDRKDDYDRRRSWTKDERKRAMPSVDHLIDSRLIDDRESVKAKLLHEL